MSVLNIRKYGDPVLSQKCKPVEKIDAETKKLILDMIETLYAAPGVGLAANQVGVPLQVVVIDVRPEGKHQPFILLNPKIVDKKGKLQEEEGCLSIPDIHARVKRFKTVRVEAINEKGMPVVIEGTDMLSRALQHELDHLEGITFVDRLPIWLRTRVKSEIKKRRKAEKW